MDRTVCSIATIAAVVEPDGLNANWSLKSSDGCEFKFKFKLKI